MPLERLDHTRFFVYEFPMASLPPILGPDPFHLENTADPETARRECCRWYYRIYPPSSLLSDGAFYDWPGPEYEEPVVKRDPRHPTVKDLDP